MVINLPACSQCQSRKRDAVLQLTDLRITDNYIYHKRFSSCESHNLFSFIVNEEPMLERKSLTSSEESLIFFCRKVKAKL